MTDANEQRIEANGISLNYCLDGPENAPVLMLSNSLGTNLHMWDWQQDAFARAFRLLRYDSRGHGRSDAPEGPYSIEMLGRDALGLLDALGIEKASFCGLSKGGMVGQWLGAHAGERLERLVLCNTSAHLPPPELWEERIAAVLSGGMAPVVQGVVDRWFTPAFQQSHAGDVDKVREMILATPPAGYAACCMAIRDMDQRGDLGRIAVPTLIIVGANDPATPPSLGEALHAGISGSTLAALDAAHLSNIEDAANFTETVLAFLKKG